ncbi:ABC transporter permease [Rhodobacteraceae bacterium Araon29]
MLIDQSKIVALITATLFLVFSLFLNGFLSIDNLLSLLRSVSVLGILGIGMALVVISRGVDLSMVAIMVIGTAISVVIAQPGGVFESGVPFWLALSAGIIFVITMGAISGFLVAYGELPAIFATLAMGGIVYGIGRVGLISSDSNYLPADAGWVEFLGRGKIFGVPIPIICFLTIALVFTLILRRTTLGKYIYAIGDNPVAARSAGIPVRPTIMLIYIVSGLIALVAGLLISGAVSQINTRLYTSTMIYDVLLVVVVGGIGLSGGKGGMINVLLGTVMIGVLLNGMTIMNLSHTEQNLIKGLVLLVAIVIDTLVNPRDEQTSQQGDI